MCSLLLQALVKVDGGGLGAALSYPLLQVFLQPANTHGAAKKKIEKEMERGYKTGHHWLNGTHLMSYKL